MPVTEAPAISQGMKTLFAGLNAVCGAGLEILPPESRLGLVGLQASAQVALSGLEVTQKTISSEGYTVPMHIVRPTRTADTVLPIFIFIHGGGWVLGASVSPAKPACPPRRATKARFTISAC